MKKTCNPEKALIPGKAPKKPCKPLGKVQPKEKALSKSLGEALQTAGKPRKFREKPCKHHGGLGASLACFSFGLGAAPAASSRSTMPTWPRAAATCNAVARLRLLMLTLPTATGASQNRGPLLGWFFRGNQNKIEKHPNDAQSFIWNIYASPSPHHCIYIYTYMIYIYIYIYYVYIYICMCTNYLFSTCFPRLGTRLSGSHVPFGKFAMARCTELPKGPEGNLSNRCLCTKPCRWEGIPLQFDHPGLNHPNRLRE